MTRTAPEDWIPCPRGEFGRLRVRLLVRRRLRVCLALVTALVASAVAFGAVQLVVTLTGPRGSAATSCHSTDVAPTPPVANCPPTNP